MQCKPNSASCIQQVAIPCMFCAVLYCCSRAATFIAVLFKLPVCIETLRLVVNSKHPTKAQHLKHAMSCSQCVCLYYKQTYWLTHTHVIVQNQALAHTNNTSLQCCHTLSYVCICVARNVLQDKQIRRCCASTHCAGHTPSCSAPCFPAPNMSSCGQSQDIGYTDPYWYTMWLLTTRGWLTSSYMLSCCTCRAKSQYQAAVKRISELEDLQQQAMHRSHQQELDLHHKEAALVAAKQNVRSALVEHMRSTTASMMIPVTMYCLTRLHG